MDQNNSLFGQIVIFKYLNKTIILTDTYPCCDGVSIIFSETNFMEAQKIGYF